jgi:hypothetical protein
MMRIARLTDRFKINLEGVTVTVAPLSGRQKLEMTSLIDQRKDGKFYIDKAAQELYLIKHSVKELKGIKDHDDAEYALEFEGEYLSDTCAEELLGFLVNTYFTTANTQAMNGVFGDVVNPMTGKPIDGIVVDRVAKMKDEEKKES